MKKREIHESRDNETGQIDRRTVITEDGKGFIPDPPSVRVIHEKITPGFFVPKDKETISDVTRTTPRQ